VHDQVVHESALGIIAVWANPCHGVPPERTDDTGRPKQREWTCYVREVDLAAERRYQREAVAASFAIAVVAAVFASAAFPFFPRSEDALFLAVNMGLLLGIAYVPPLLQSSPAFLVRSISWQVKTRWVLLLAAIFYWIVAVRPDGGRRFFAAATALAAVSLAAFAVGRRQWHAHEIAWTMLFAGDLAVLVYASDALEASLTLAVLAGISAFLLIV